jgi:hypothetical protein
MGTSIAKLCGNRSRRTSIENVSNMNAVSLAGTGRAREGAGRTSGAGHSEHPDITPHAQTARGYPPQFLVRSLHWICWRFSAWLRTFSLRTMSLLTMTLPPFTAAVLSSRTRLSDRAIVHPLHGGLPEDCLYAPQKDANDSPGPNPGSDMRTARERRRGPGDLPRSTRWAFGQPVRRSPESGCPSPKPRPPAKWLIYRSGSGHYLSSMITLLLHLFRLLPFLFGGHRQLALENLVLRQQLAVYKRTTTRPKLRAPDRLFWVGLAGIWAGWRQSLVIVTPAQSYGGTGVASASTGASSRAAQLEGGRPSTSRSGP